jgi:hypothetical protein
MILAITSAEIVAVASTTVIGLLLFQWLIQLPSRLRKSRSDHQQEQQDDNEYWEYQKKKDAIRTKYDPRNEWNEGASVPDKYTEEVRKVNLEHRSMLQRRNGWKDIDFAE